MFQEILEIIIDFVLTKVIHVKVKDFLY